MDPEALEKGSPNEFEFHLVQCNVGFTGDALPCEEIATTYAGAVRTRPSSS